MEVEVEEEFKKGMLGQKEEEVRVEAKVVDAIGKKLEEVAD